MIEILRSLGEMFVSLVQVVIHTISTLVSFLTIIPRFITSLLTYVTYIPAWLSTFIVAAIGILVVKLIIGRE